MTASNSALKVMLLAYLLYSTGISLTNSEETSSSKSYPITTLLNAKWGQTPLYLEISEYLADENPNLYWDFVKAISRLDCPLAEIETESKQYITSINVVRSILSTSQMPLLKLVVSMHSLTPRIQAHFQIAMEVQTRGNCDAANFVTVDNEIACSLSEMKNKLNEVDTTSTVDTYSFDHVYPGSENNTKVVILYGDIGSKEYADYHKYLKNIALDLNIKYISRHFIRNAPEKKVRLSGYGVELYLKSTEYKSQDDSPKQTNETESSDEVDEAEIEGFNFAALKSKFPKMAHSLNQLRNSLLQKNDEIALLKAWEFQDLGLQAAERVAQIQGEEALQILQFTAQNFPTQAKSLLQENVSDGLRKEIQQNTEVFGRSLNIVPPDGALFVNGLFFDSDTLDLSSLVETTRSEIRVLESLHSNNIKGKIASSLLALDLSSSSTKDFAIDIRDTAIMWINDIEKDQHYRHWPSSVMDLLRPTFPGMLRNIKKNVFNLVLIVDPLKPSCRSLIKLAESFVIHTAPVRLGIVFDTLSSSGTTDEDDYMAIFCAFNYVTQKLDSRSALGFLTDIFAAVKPTEQITAKHIRLQLKKAFDSLSVSKIDDILSEDSDFDYGRKLSEEFVERLGFKSVPQALLNGVPMLQSLLQADSDFEEAIFTEIIQQTSVLQKSVYRGDLTDSDTVIDYLMNQPHVMPRLNQRILANEDAKFIDLTGTAYQDLGNVRSLAQLTNRDMTATLMNNIKYFGAKHSTEQISNMKIHFLTLWIFADLDKPQGRELLSSALKYMKASTSVRVAFIPNVEGGNISRKDNLNRLVWAATQTLSSIEATECTLRWLRNPSDTLDIPESISEIISSTELHMKMLRVYSQRVMNLQKSQRLILANGKIFGPLTHDETFSIDDFGLIDRFNAHQYGDKIRKVLTNSDDDLDISSDSLLKLYATLVPRQTKTRFTIPTDIKEDFSVVKLQPKHGDEPHFDISAVIDPASRAAQKLAPILILLRNVINCNMRVYLIPITQHSDMPVKNFYRYVVEPEVQFLPNGKHSEGPLAKFSGLPASPLLTQNLQVPENWLVEAVRSVYDLDNIKLSHIGGPVHSEFELEYLLLEGHCFDSISGAPPRGLQVTLGTLDNPTLVDTIVMANLGYFQLKANPGIWELRVREGKSTDIYDISYAEGPNTVHVNNSTRIMISSFRSHVIKLRVTKKPGMNNADLLGDDEETAQSGIWNSITSSFGGSSSGGDTHLETINVFSVASGHLYERLLRIMMISLLKHTKSPVKFWFLKNYLSPQFTDFLPHMAREYGFQYELVQYKWPRWLHQQTEKQRTIWGYKILFLDVLFPLNIRKIIFVDADAIVRADLKELYNMDLNGAPYAYTPFCDSRKEMEGFRFWKQGYWRSHLMGRRYHISALYVVDLKKFRKIAAGDRLRGQYQALSQDPNSLSNLDQDLPNNMIHQVAIKSLPEEWLWCQTWCSDKSFKNAKVIDLCNNPQTKEAKLTAAQRIVPEWKDYDLELKKLLAKIEDHENSEHDDASSSEFRSDPEIQFDVPGLADTSDENSPKHSEL